MFSVKERQQKRVITTLNKKKNPFNHQFRLSKVKAILMCFHRIVSLFKEENSSLWKSSHCYLEAEDVWCMLWDLNHSEVYWLSNCRMKKNKVSKCLCKTIPS